MSLFVPSSSMGGGFQTEYAVAPRPELALGTFVRVDQRVGRIRYLGRTRFADGFWVGVELVEPYGKNNGSVQGVDYFQCAPSHGLFVRPDRVTIIGKREYMYTARGSSGPAPFASLPLSMVADVAVVPSAQLDNVPFVPEGLVAHDSLGPTAQVLWRGTPATVVHVGRTLFARGVWVGLDLGGEPIPPSSNTDPGKRVSPYFRWQGAHLTLVFVKESSPEIEVVVPAPCDPEALPAPAVQMVDRGEESDQPVYLEESGDVSYAQDLERMRMAETGPIGGGGSHSGSDALLASSLHPSELDDPEYDAEFADESALAASDLRAPERHGEELVLQDYEELHFDDTDYMFDE